MVADSIEKRAVGAGCLVLFSLPFAFVGMAFSLAPIAQVCREFSMLSWTETPCKILATKLLEDQDSDGDVTYTTTARYCYFVDGIEHVSERVAIDPRCNAREIHSDLEAFRRVNEPYRCYVNPRRSDDAILVREYPWHAAAFQTIFGLVFSIFGFGLMGSAVYGYFSARKQRAPVPGSLPPWRRQRDGVSSPIRHSDWLPGRVLCGVSLVATLISAPSVWTGARELLRTGSPWPLIGFIPLAASLVPYWFGRRRWNRWDRFGDSSFRLSAGPFLIGGELAGVIQSQKPFESPEGFALRIYCTETVPSTDSDETDKSTVIFELEKSIAWAECTAKSDGTSIPVAFSLPANAPDALDNQTSGERVWRLSARSITPNVDYLAVFEIPAFRHSDDVAPTEELSQ